MLRVKRLFDITLSSVGILLFLLPVLLIALAIKLTSRGSVFYTQKRVGRDGKLFTTIKFRTMSTGAEREGPITAASDSRITPIGRFLRRYKLDELPQLWNVLAGAMSFVGPRPDVPGYADRLTGEARNILRLRPGITGPATLYFRNEEELLAKADDPRRYNDEVIWPKKVEMNLAYYRNHSLLKDVQYILQSVFSRKSPSSSEPG
jgi:lipopolysaccharide/colanic/teichoic acid biosynthesis glycosyltransferase